MMDCMQRSKAKPARTLSKTETTNSIKERGSGGAQWMSIITRSGCCRTNCCNRSHVMEFGSSGWFDYKEEQEEQEEAAAAESCRKQQKTHTIWRKRGEMGTIQTTKWYCRIYNLVDWINCRESNQDLVQNLEEERRKKKKTEFHEEEQEEISWRRDVMEKKEKKGKEENGWVGVLVFWKF